MEITDDQQSNGRPTDHFYIVSGAEMNSIVVPLTVVHAYVQLLRRRLEKGTLSGTDDLDVALARMEEATHTMTADLWAIMKATTHP